MMSPESHAHQEKRLDAARGYLFFEMPDYALGELKKVREPVGTAFDVHYLRGEALRQKKAYEDALEAFQQAFDEKPDDLSVALGMAWCYKRIHQLPQAIAIMSEIYQSHPKEPIVLYNLSCYLALAGEKERALSWLGRALRMDASFRKLISDESDFDALRNDPDFQFIVGLEPDDDHSSTDSQHDAD